MHWPGFGLCDEDDRGDPIRKAEGEDGRRHARDIEAAQAAGVCTLAGVTGGFSAQELREAGAWGGYESVAELEERLDETPLAGAVDS